MNALELLEAFEQIPDEYILEAKDMNYHKSKQSASRRLRTALIAAAIAAALLAITAFAAANFLGVREMTQGTTYAIPSQAEEFIETQSAQTTLDGMTFTVVESLFDASTFMVSVGITGDEQMLLAPSYCDPQSSVSEIGLQGNETLEEYAQRQGKTLAFLSLDINDRDALGISVATVMAESQSENSITMLCTGQKDSGTVVDEASCTVAVRIGKDVQLVPLAFRVNQAPTERIRVYQAEITDPVPGYTVRSVRVSDTPLGLTLEFDDTITDDALFSNIKRPDIQGVSYSEGGWLMGVDGEYHLTLSRCQGALGDAFQMVFLDWDNNIAGTVHFTLQGEISKE